MLVISLAQFTKIPDRDPLRSSGAACRTPDVPCITSSSSRGPRSPRSQQTPLCFMPGLTELCVRLVSEFWWWAAIVTWKMTTYPLSSNIAWILKSRNKLLVPEQRRKNNDLLLQVTIHRRSRWTFFCCLALRHRFSLSIGGCSRGRRASRSSCLPLRRLRQPPTIQTWWLTVRPKLCSLN